VVQIVNPNNFVPLVHLRSGLINLGLRVTTHEKTILHMVEVTICSPSEVQGVFIDPSWRIVAAERLRFRVYAGVETYGGRSVM